MWAQTGPTSKIGFATPEIVLLYWLCGTAAPRLNSIVVSLEIAVTNGSDASLLSRTHSQDQLGNDRHRTSGLFEATVGFPAKAQ